MSLEGAQLGHYRLTRFLKGGGMGEVYLAEDLTLSRQVAIKVMKGEEALYPDSQSAQDAKRLFQREMTVIAGLDHPNILTLLESGEQNIDNERITYMVMPYCPAGSLADWIKQYHGKSLLTPQEVAQLLTQAAGGLQHAHDQHILHLDIKPQNFLVRRQQDQKALPNLLLADFGVAKIANTTKMTGTARGTLAYMAPEQMAGQPVPASDQYALAIMTYELLTGKTPFDGAPSQAIMYQHAQVMPEAPSKMNPSLPSALDGMILKALAKKPEERFPSVREFAQAFAAALKPGASRESGAYTGATYLAPPRQRPVSLPPTPSSSSPAVPSPSSSPVVPSSSPSPVIPPPPLSPAVPPSSPSPAAPWPPRYPSYSGYPPSQPYPASQPYPPSQPYPSYTSHPGYPAYQQHQPYQQSTYPSGGQPPPWQPPKKRKLGFWWAILFGVITGFFVYNILDLQTYSPSMWKSTLILPCLMVILASLITSSITRRIGTGTFTGVVAVITYIVRIVVDTHSQNYYDYSFLFGIVPTAMLLGFIGGCLAVIAIEGMMRLIKRTPKAGS